MMMMETVMMISVIFFFFSPAVGILEDTTAVLSLRILSHQVSSTYIFTLVVKYVTVKGFELNYGVCVCDYDYQVVTHHPCRGL